MHLSPRQIKHFQDRIWDFYRKNGRNLPWRSTTDPYKIFISEVMLQQTQVVRVISKYEKFIKLFPDIFSLAVAPLASVLKVWSGLGYNRRARFLREAAIIICDKYSGMIPRDPELVDALPGIGKSTAAAIIVFSYNVPLVFIETNIRRVFIDYFFNMFHPVILGSEATPESGKKRFWTSQNDKAHKIHDRDILPLVEQTLDKKDPRQWYFALMDYGTHLGKTKENSNKKSAHYVKQPQFEGSQRQLRGRILRILLEEKKISKQKLKSVLLFDPSSDRENFPASPAGGSLRSKNSRMNISSILQSLNKDRLIEITGDTVSIHS